MSGVKDRLLSVLKREPVLIIAAVLACVSAFFVPPSRDYLSYIDFKTLACLFCLMASVKGLEREGILERISLLISAKIKNLRVLGFFLVFCCFFFSMLITNDVALIAIVPITFGILSACGLEKWSALIVVLQTIAANIGSSLTPIGNPQNLYLFTHYEMPLGVFLSVMFPIVSIGGVLLAVCCFLVPKQVIEQAELHKLPETRKARTLFYFVLFILSVASVFGALPYIAVTAVVIMVTAIVDRKTLIKVDYSLLLTFIVIFVFVGNLSNVEPIHAFLSGITSKNTLLTAAFASQITSNVPAAILLSGFTGSPEPLLAGVNIGGVGTLIASMASVISYKLFAGTYKDQAGRYFKIFTLLNLLFLAVLTIAGFLLSLG